MQMFCPGTVVSTAPILVYECKTKGGGGGKNECTHIRYTKKNVMMELCSERNMPKRAARRTKKMTRN